VDERADDEQEDDGRRHPSETTPRAPTVPYLAARPRSNPELFPPARRVVPARVHGRFARVNGRVSDVPRRSMVDASPVRCVGAGRFGVGCETRGPASERVPNQVGRRGCRRPDYS
jgi:hypothetical protein